MLFHITARHSVDECSMYNEGVRRALQEFVPTIRERCTELGIKVHFALAGHPDHVFFLLVEADDYTSVCVLLTSVPMKQEFDIKPVRMLSAMGQF